MEKKLRFLKTYNKLAKYLHRITQFEKKKEAHKPTIENIKNTRVNTRLIDHMHM